MQLSPIQNFFCNCAYEILLNQKNEVKKKKSRGAISAEKSPLIIHISACALYYYLGFPGGKGGKNKRYIYIIYIYIFFLLFR